MPRWLISALAGALLGACQTGIPNSSRDDGMFALKLELYLDSLGLGREQLYEDPAHFYALLTCPLDDNLAHLSDGRHKLEGPFEHGRITLRPPSCCRRATLFELDVWPENLDDCYTKHVGPLDMTSPNFPEQLRIVILCEARAHFGTVKF